MSKENALTIGLVPTEFNRSPVFIKSVDNPDTDYAIAVYQSRCTAARQLNGCETDVRRAMNKAQASIYPDEFVFGRVVEYHELSPSRQTNVLDLITEAVIRVQIEERLKFEQLGIDLEALKREFTDARSGKATARPMSDIWADILSLPAEQLRSFIQSKPRFQVEKSHANQR